MMSLRQAINLFDVSLEQAARERGEQLQQESPESPDQVLRRQLVHAANIASHLKYGPPDGVGDESADADSEGESVLSREAGNDSSATSAMQTPVGANTPTTIPTRRSNRINKGTRTRQDLIDEDFDRVGAYSTGIGNRSGY